MKYRHKFEEKKYIFPGSIEVERIRTGKPPDKGKGRQKREKPTPEQMRRQNEYNKRKYMRRLIKANFGENDYWLTLTYLRGKTMTLEDAVKDRAKFLKEVRKEFKKRGYKLKWIGRTERGKRGAVHHHLIIGRIPDADIIIARAWKKVQGAGKSNLQLLYEKGQFADLAAYITKPGPEDEEPGQAPQSNYSRSRNLTIPQPKVSRTTRKKILQESVPTPGYYIDKDSICQGINSITGREYLHYIEIRLKEGSG